MSTSSIRGLYSFNIINSLDINYSAVLDIAVSNGIQLPSNSNRTLQNRFIKALKSNGLWYRKSALWMYCHDSDDHRFGLIDWVSPSRTLAQTNGTINFIKKLGYKGNGSNFYVDLNHKPITDGPLGVFTYQLSHLTIGIEDDISHDGVDCGVQNSTGNERIFFRSWSLANNCQFNLCGDSAGTQTRTGRTNSRGIFTLNRTNDVHTVRSGPSDNGFGIGGFVNSTLAAHDLVTHARNANGTITDYSIRTISTIQLGARLNSEELALNGIVNQNYIRSVRIS